MEEKIIKTEGLEKATFAGGCFWCVEAKFDNVEGVATAISGYSGGEKINPSYEEVSSGTTGHLEAVQIIYDPGLISYHELLDLFWKSFDPTDDGGQFADRGEQYKTAIFYHNQEQKKQAEESKIIIQKEFDEPIVTKIIPFKNFFIAEEYHQDYAEKKVAQYKIYEAASGRKSFLKQKWG